MLTEERGRAEMNRDNLIKLVMAAVLLITTIIFVQLDNEIIFPSTMVGFFLVLTTFKRDYSSKTPSGCAARRAILIFSILVIAFNILASLYMPRLAASSDLMQYYSEQTTDSGAKTSGELEDHFVEVTINDAHELCYSTSFLLVLYGAFLLVPSKRRG